MNKESVKLELYVSDIWNILNAFQIQENETGNDEDVKKTIWAMNMQLRKQGYEIKHDDFGYQVVRKKTPLTT